MANHGVRRRVDPLQHRLPAPAPGRHDLSRGLRSGRPPRHLDRRGPGRRRQRVGLRDRRRVRHHLLRHRRRGAILGGTTPQPAVAGVATLPRPEPQPPRPLRARSTRCRASRRRSAGASPSGPPSPSPDRRRSARDAPRRTRRTRASTPTRGRIDGAPSTGARSTASSSQPTPSSPGNAVHPGGRGPGGQLCAADGLEERATSGDLDTVTHHHRRAVHGLRGLPRGDVHRDRRPAAASRQPPVGLSGPSPAGTIIPIPAETGGHLRPQGHRLPRARHLLPRGDDDAHVRRAPVGSPTRSWSASPPAVPGGEAQSLGRHLPRAQHRRRERAPVGEHHGARPGA